MKFFSITFFNSTELNTLGKIFLSTNNFENKDKKLLILFIESFGIIFGKDCPSKIKFVSYYLLILDLIILFFSRSISFLLADSFGILRFFDISIILNFPTLTDF